MKHHNWIRFLAILLLMFPHHVDLASRSSDTGNLIWSFSLAFGALLLAEDSKDNSEPID